MAKIRGAIANLDDDDDPFGSPSRRSLQVGEGSTFANRAPPQGGAADDDKGDEERKGIFLSSNSTLGPIITKLSMNRMTAMTPALVLHNVDNALKKNQPVEPQMQPRFAAVMFVDISGYTLVADMLQKKYGQADGSERLSSALNLYYTQMLTVIGSYGGETPLYCGDACMAVWLVDTPEQLVNVCKQVVACGLQLIRDHGTFPVDEATFGLHIGASCGEVVTMVIGGAQSLEQGKYKFVVTGNPVLKSAKAVGYGSRNDFVVYEELRNVVKDHLSMTTEELQDGFYMCRSCERIDGLCTPQATSIPEEIANNNDIVGAASLFSCDPAIRFAAKENTVGELRVVSSVFICFYEIS
eukprot:PhF_6_TR34701/c0_g2_i1/m.50497